MTGITREHEWRVSVSLQDLAEEVELHAEGSPVGAMWIRFRWERLRHAVILAEANGVRCE